MAPMIELPGEANPLTLQNVYNTLVSAASSTQQQVQTGTQQLQNWEKEANYYSLLQVRQSNLDLCRSLRANENGRKYSSITLSRLKCGIYQLYS